MKNGVASKKEGHALEKNFDILIEAAVDPVEEDVVVAFVTLRTLGVGVGEGVV